MCLCVCLCQRLESDIDGKSAVLSRLSSLCDSVTTTDKLSSFDASQLRRSVDELNSEFERLRDKAAQRRAL